MRAGSGATASSEPALLSQRLSTPDEEMNAKATASTHGSKSSLRLLASLLRLLDLSLLGALTFCHDLSSLSLSMCVRLLGFPPRPYSGPRFTVWSCPLPGMVTHLRPGSHAQVTDAALSHGQAADLHRSSGVLPQPIQPYAGQT